MKFCWLLFLLLPAWALAQPNPGASFFIRGTLTDAQKNAVPFGSVGLYRAPDSTLVNGVASDEAGKFEIPARPGRYYLKITMMSFQDRIIPNIQVQAQDVALGTLPLKTSAELLEEVLV